MPHSLERQVNESALVGLKGTQKGLKETSRV